MGEKGEKMVDNIEWTTEITPDGIKHTAFIPSPRIVDTSHWPEFTVEWMGRQIPCKYLGDNVYLIGNKIWVRGPKGEDYIEMRLEDISLKEES